MWSLVACRPGARVAAAAGIAPGIHGPALKVFEDISSSIYINLKYIST
jgi:hypothetical protein